MRKTTKTGSSSPPVHLHISEATPLHVHVKSHRSPPRMPQEKTKNDRGILRPTAKVKTRVPWIPPGKVSTRDAAYKWEGPTHCLEITSPLLEPEPEHSQSVLRLSQLTSEEGGEGLHGHISQYEKKIDSLLSEVNSLKNQVELRKKEQLLEQQSEQLNVSQRVIIEQEEELAEVTKELEQTERENTRLRQSMEKMLEESDCTRLDKDNVQQDKDALLRELMEAEVDGSAVAKEVSALRMSVSKLYGAAGGKLSGSDSSTLARQNELLLQKLETFEATNRKLRLLLREQQGSQVEFSEQRDALLKRLADTEAENAQLVVKLQEKDREVTHLSKRVDAEKENAKSTVDLSKSLESVRAHLQGQLRRKEAENNRLTVQIQNLERAANQQKVEVDSVTEQLVRLRQQASEDREALKRATRAQKQRAERSEDTAGQLSIQLVDMEKQVVEVLSAAETWQSQYAQELKDKSKREAELSLLNSRIAELTEQLQATADKGRVEREGLLDHLHRLTVLRMKVEMQGSQVELLRQKNKVLLEENRQLQQRAETLERKLEETGSQNAELLSVIATREDTLRSNQLRLEERTRECSLLSLKLEEALGDAQQQMSETRGQAATKERSTQSKIRNLETQLSKTTSEINQVRRSKEEVERRYQSRLQDMKDRLEQSDSTNRSLQNYIQFLKASYANVFGDLAPDSSLRGPSPI